MERRRNWTRHGAELNDILPFVRVIVPAFNKAEMTASCFRSLMSTEWPLDRIDLVLIDNGCSDDTVTRVIEEFPDVRVVSSSRNLGFAGGCNLGIISGKDAHGRDMKPFDYLALVNNDAVVEPAWLKELVTVAEQAPDVGAVAAKILLAPKFSEVAISPLVARTSGPVYVEIRDVLIDGVRQDHRLKFDEVFVRDSVVNSNGVHSLWLGKPGAIRIIEDPLEDREPMVVTLEMSATSGVEVRLHSGDNEYSTLVPDRSDSVRVDFGVQRESFDVVNSAGGELYRDGFGGDRGYLERDLGQFDDSVEVFSWCGAGALIRRSFLDEVGAFDQRLFLYYEDFDLSWRGRLAGWRYMYAPRSVIRHHHAQTSIEGSDMFRFYTARNRLLVLAKNAPIGLAARSLLGEFKRFIAALWGSVASLNERNRLEQRRELSFRKGVVVSYLQHVLSMMMRRWTMVRRVKRRALMAWSVDKRNDPGFVIDRGVIRAGVTRTRI